MTHAIETSVKADLSGDRGFALASVLVLAILISLLALTLMTLSRLLAIEGSAIATEARARGSAEAGLNRAILAFARQGDALRETLIPDGRAVEWEFHEATLILRAQAESGKLDVNAGDRAHIAALMERVVEGQDRRFQILARLDDARQRGGGIRSLAELLPPFDRMTGLLDVFTRYFTVLTDQRGIDPATAPAVIVETLPGLSGDVQQRILEARATGRALPFVDIPAVVAQNFAAQRPIYRFSARVRSNGDRIMAMAATVGFSEQTGISVYAWGRTTPEE
jgi:hypothetical protein